MTYPKQTGNLANLGCKTHDLINIKYLETLGGIVLTRIDITHVGCKRGEMLTCLIGMALPLPMLSVLLSTLFACSLAFRDCKKTRKSISHWSDTPRTKQWEGVECREVFGCGSMRWSVCLGERERDCGSEGRGEGLCFEHFVEKLDFAK